MACIDDYCTGFYADSYILSGVSSFYVDTFIDNIYSSPTTSVP